MAYSDYGGYAYLNGKRVEDRSDATIMPDGTVWGTPGQYPGFAGVPRDLPNGHVVLGSCGLLVVLYKQTSVSVYRGIEEVDLPSLVSEENGTVAYGGGARYINYDHYISTDAPAVFEIDGHKLTVKWESGDNFYIYAKLEQPNGDVWTGFSGYGVGAGLEDCGYGYSTESCVAELFGLFPVNTVVPA